MGMNGRSIVVVGEVRSQTDLTLDGRVDGPIWCEGRLTIETVDEPEQIA